MTGRATMVMGSTSLPARWESRLVGFSPAVPGPVRLHWYAEGSELSACGNHRRAPMCLTYAEEQAPCPRCIEALQWAGKPVPAAPSPPEDA